MDLSVIAPPPTSSLVTAAAAPATATQRAQQQPKPATRFERVFLDVNFGIAWANEDEFVYEVEGPLFEETRTYRMSYASPTGASFDFGGGVMFTRELGVGISFAGTAHESPTELFVSVPHPFAFNAHATDSQDTDRKFQRVEGSANIQLVGATQIGERVRVRAFGGPTWFRVEQDLVNDIRYVQVFGVFTRANEVAITEYDYVPKVEATGWGFHVGGDITYFFNRVVGLGAFARYSRGTVDIDDQVTGETFELVTGGIQLGGGLRFKF